MREARDDAINNGVTAVNGIVILTLTPLPYNPEHTNPPGGLENYYRENVVAGTNAFVMVAQGFETFGKALIAKLVREISALPMPESVMPG